MGIAVSAIGFGFVYGLSAREAGFSPIEVLAMSVLVFGGASQFAAVGYVASGLAWPGIVLLTALLNARHLLYSAALAPWLSKVPFGRRAVMATADVPVYRSETVALKAELNGAAANGHGRGADAPRVIVLMCHEEREEVFELLAALGARPVDIASELTTIVPRLQERPRRG